MKTLMRLDKKQLPKHIIVWILVSIYVLRGKFFGTWSSTLVGSAIGMINYMFVFYSLYLYVFPKYWIRNRILLFLHIILVLSFYWGIFYLNSLKIIPALGGKTYYQLETVAYFLDATFYFFVITGIEGTISFFNRYGLYKLKQQAEKEKLLLVKEISLIRNQFNSKFTFDFLNYCNRSIKSYSPDTATSVVLFSDMLNYTLQTRPDEKVLLKDETAYIENFISIQKLLSSKVFVQFKYPTNTGDIQIQPRILITFVENAFKHGLCNNPEHPINITLTVENDKLIFTICNLVNRNKKIASTHTGLENVRQILNLYYANNYELRIDDEGGVFYVELELMIDHG